jgi:hypothetical protein
MKRREQCKNNFLNIPQGKDINVRLKCTFGPPIFKKIEFWSPYFKNQLFSPPNLIFFLFWSPSHFEANFVDMALPLMTWQHLCGKI